jgi:MSHA pilin protein MshD
MLVMAARSRGFTLIEMIITIVVVSVGLTGILLAFQVAVRSSADPLVNKQLISIAEAQMEAMVLREFADLADDASCATCPAGYASAVTVTQPTATWSGLPLADVRIITVTVTRGTETFRLVGRRTNYAP